MPEDESGFSTRLVADIRGVVTCNYPCVPECKREHPWDEHVDLSQPGALKRLFARNRAKFGDLRMTVGIAAATANADLERFRNTAAAAIATPFIQLHTADPGAAGTTAVSAGSTTRNAITWNAASAGSMTLATLAAWTNGGTSETISHATIFSASTAGTFHHSFALSVGQAWVSTNTLTLTTFTLSRTPIAA